MVSLSGTADDVSLTSDLLKPEHQRRADSANALLNSKCCDCSHHSSQVSLANQDELCMRSRSDSTKVNRLKSAHGRSDKSDNVDSDCWETASMKQQLQIAKSISAIDLLQQFKESGVFEKDFGNDNDEVWTWFESHADSGRSSPVGDEQNGASLEELITVRST